MDKVRVTRSTDGPAKTWEFPRSRDNADVWQVAPEGGQAADADRPKVDDLLNKLTDLKMGALVDATRPTGLPSPILNVSVSYDSGKFERVRIGRAGGQHYGNREGEQATGEVTAATLEAALQALDGAIAPPAKPAETSTPPAAKPVMTRRSGAGAVVLSLTAALGLAGCAAHASAARSQEEPHRGKPVAPAVAPPAAQLALDLSALFTAPDLSHAHLAVLVRSLLTGETLYALNDRRMMVPASTRSCSPLLRRRNSGGTTDTRRASWPPARSSPMAPSTATSSSLAAATHHQPAASGPLDGAGRVGGRVAARGVKVINGHLIGDDNAFAEPGWGSGWSWDDLVADYGSPSALSNTTRTKWSC